MGIVNREFLPVTLESLRSGLPDAGNIVIAQGKMLWNTNALWVLLVIVAVAWLEAYRRGIRFACFLFPVVFSVFVFCGLSTCIYILSDYPSRILQVYESFDRLFMPIIIIVGVSLLCWPFVQWPGYLGFNGRSATTSGQ
jgi:hypothetical protein